VISTSLEGVSSSSRVEPASTRKEGRPIAAESMRLGRAAAWFRDRRCAPPRPGSRLVRIESLFFLNNSPEPLEATMAVPPSALELTGPRVSLAEITGSGSRIPSTPGGTSPFPKPPMDW